MQNISRNFPTNTDICAAGTLTPWSRSSFLAYLVTFSWSNLFPSPTERSLSFCRRSRMRVNGPVGPAHVVDAPRTHPGGWAEDTHPQEALFSPARSFSSTTLSLSVGIFSSTMSWTLRWE